MLTDPRPTRALFLSFSLSIFLLRFPQQVRQRFGLLVVGYNTKRGSLIMAWEPIVVMLRKLFITLAGSALRDPHIQIMVSLIILVSSLALQALVQPYESIVLNVLDVLSILALFTTQSLSIVYLYLDQMDAANPLGLNRQALESGMTVVLFALNLSVIAILLLAYVGRYAYEQFTRDGRRSKIIAGRSSLTLESLGKEAGLEMTAMREEEEEARLHGRDGGPAPTMVLMLDNPLGLRHLRDGRTAQLAVADSPASLRVVDVHFEDASELREPAADAAAAGDEVGGAALPASVVAHAVQLPDAEPLPSGWEAHLHSDESGGTTVYYHNRSLGESLWERPAEDREDEYFGSRRISAAQHI